jgi:hypothetical protein
VIFGVQVICLCRNSLHLIVAYLYCLQSIMYNDLILMVHKLVAPLQHQTINIMLSHGIVKLIAVTGQLSLIDGVINAIDAQVAKNKGDAFSSASYQSCD